MTAAEWLVEGRDGMEAATVRRATRRKKRCIFLLGLSKAACRKGTVRGPFRSSPALISSQKAWLDFFLLISFSSVACNNALRS